jgi:hypothetical protein
MTTVSAKPAVNFGSIYQRALKSKLKEIGANLAALRNARNENIPTVANLVQVAPGVLQSIEDGNLDFQLQILFDLCDYYGAELQSVLGKVDLIEIR